MLWIYHRLWTTVSSSMFEWNNSDSIYTHSPLPACYTRWIMLLPGNSQGKFSLVCWFITRFWQLLKTELEKNEQLKETQKHFRGPKRRSLENRLKQEPLGHPVSCLWVSQIAAENLLVMPHNKALIIPTLIILMAPMLQDHLPRYKVHKRKSK